MDTYDNNRHLPKEEWIQEFRNDISRDFDETLNTKEGHFYDHVSHTDKEMLTNLILGTKHFDAVFTDEKRAKKLVTRIMDYKASTIADWLSADKRNFKNIDEYKNLHFSFKFSKSEAVGRGFNKNLEEKATKQVDVFLRRDPSGRSPYGFYLETGFPNIMHEQAWETGRVYTKDEVIQGGYVPFPNDYEKIAFKFQNEYEDITLRTSTDMAGNPQVKITFEDTYGNYVAYLGDDYVKCMHFGEQGRTYPKLNEMPQEYKEFIEEVQEYQKYLEHMPMEDRISELEKYGGPIQSETLGIEEISHNRVGDRDSR